MKIIKELQNRQAAYNTRRHFLKTCTTGLGGMALASLFGCSNLSTDSFDPEAIQKAVLQKLSHFAPKAKRVIYMHMAGSPSQLELFDYKPMLEKLHNQPCPESLTKRKKVCLHLWYTYDVRATGKVLSSTVNLVLGYLIYCPIFQKWSMKFVSLKHCIQKNSTMLLHNL